MRLSDKIVAQLEEDLKRGDITAIEEMIDVLLENDENLDIMLNYLPES